MVELESWDDSKNLRTFLNWKTASNEAVAECKAWISTALGIKPPFTVAARAGWVSTTPGPSGNSAYVTIRRVDQPDVVVEVFPNNHFKYSGDSDVDSRDSSDTDD